MTGIIVNLLITIMEIFSILILVEVIGSWVLVARVQLPDVALRVLQAISSITGVILNPIRRLVPNLGGLDISPIIALLLLQVLQRALYTLR
jgi:YggT family protein